MPYEYRIDRDAGLCHMRMWGALTGEQVIDLMVALYSDSAWSAHFDQLWDCADVDASALDPDMAKRIVAVVVHAAIRPHRSRSAVVVRGEEAGAIIDFVAARLRWHPDYNRIFDRVEDALEWLRPNEVLPRPAPNGARVRPAEARTAGTAGG